MKAFKSWLFGNKIIAALFILLLIEEILYLLFSHRIIETMYDGNLPILARVLLKGKDKESLEFYFKKFDTLFLAYNNVLFPLLVLGSSFCIKQFKQRNNILNSIQIEVTRTQQSFFSNKKIILLLCGLFLVFFSLYVTLGVSIIPNYAYNKFTFFYADYGDWGELEWSKFHKGSHPLILLFLAPFSSLRIFSPPFPTVVLAAIINSFFGAFGVFLSSILFWNLTQKYLETSLLTILFGLSMSQLFFSTLQESYALAGCSIITTYILFLICLKQQKLYLGYWILAGLFSFGITITNFAQTTICFAIAVLVLQKRNRVTSILEFIGAIVSFSFLLSLLQKKLFGGAYFFVPGMVTKELAWVQTTILNHPLLVSKELLKHFFLVNFVAASPFPERIISGEKIVLSFFDRPLIYSAVGLIGIVLWLFVSIEGVRRNLLSLQKKRVLPNLICKTVNYPGGFLVKIK